MGEFITNRVVVRKSSRIGRRIALLVPWVGLLAGAARRCGIEGGMRVRVIDARCTGCGHQMSAASHGLIEPSGEKVIGFEIEVAALSKGVECYYCRGSVLIATEPIGQEVTG